jgi:hypothetical protein
MRYLRNSGFCVLLGLALIMMSPDAPGAGQRSFVKSTGVDTPPGPGSCSVTSPCRSFASAIDSTNPGGEVIVLDSAGYGPVSIHRSVSIIAPPGVYAGVTVPAGGTGIDILTGGGAGVTVVLQGLTINGAGAGGYAGVFFQDGAELHVINCSISNFNVAGIYVSAPGSRVFVTDTTLRGGTSGGVGLTGSVTAVLDRVRAEGIEASYGIAVSDGASLSVRDSVFSSNHDGIAGSATGGTVTRVTIDGTLAASGTNGISATAQGAGSRATLDVIRTTSTRNGYGAVIDALPPATAVMTVTSSVVSQNGFGVYNVGSATPTAFASRNLISGNNGGGIVQQGTGIVHTRSNNAGEQASATMGTVTPVPGF